MKISIQRMTEEGKAAMEELRKQVSDYEARLEAAEELASRDTLTRLRSRLYVERQIEKRIAQSSPFCIAVLDIDGFKKVNDELGHVVGDEALKQFAGELKSACRSTDIIGRWGGDELLILLDCGLAEASAQTERVRKWVCGSYTVSSSSGPKNLELNAAIGLAEHAADENYDGIAGARRRGDVCTQEGFAQWWDSDDCFDLGKRPVVGQAFPGSVERRRLPSIQQHFSRRNWNGSSRMNK